MDEVPHEAMPSSRTHLWGWKSQWKPGHAQGRLEWLGLELFQAQWVRAAWHYAHAKRSPSWLITGACSLKRGAPLNSVLTVWEVAWTPHRSASLHEQPKLSPEACQRAGSWAQFPATPGLVPPSLGHPLLNAISDILTSTPSQPSRIKWNSNCCTCTSSDTNAISKWFVCTDSS